MAHVATGPVTGFHGARSMDRLLIARREPFLLPIYPRLIVQTLVRIGYEQDVLLDDLGFGMRELGDERFRLSVEEHEHFILRIVEVTGDPHIALRITPAIDTTTTNLTVLAIASSGQIARALDLITRYFKTITRVFSIRGVDNDKAVMALDVHLEHEQVIYFAVTSFALFLDRFFSDTLNGAHLVRHVELAIAEPEGFAAVADHYPFGLSFGHGQTRIVFHREYLDAPMPEADPQTGRLLLEMNERQLQEAEAETSFVGRVKWLLINRISSPPRLDDAARQLGVSSRSLRRKLAAAGTSFQTLLDEIRCKTAKRLLSDSDANVASIAYELGFRNPSDFGRAFKKWSGKAPATFRQELTHH